MRNPSLGASRSVPRSKHPRSYLQTCQRSCDSSQVACSFGDAGIVTATRETRQDVFHVERSLLVYRK